MLTWIAAHLLLWCLQQASAAAGRQLCECVVPQLQPWVSSSCVLPTGQLGALTVGCQDTFTVPSTQSCLLSCGGERSQGVWPTVLL